MKTTRKTVKSAAADTAFSAEERDAMKQRAAEMKSARGGAKADGEAAARTFIDAVELFSRMTHLGDVRSLILHPATTTHAGRTPEERAEQGIGDGLIRLSVGIEDVADLVRDLDRGFAALRGTGREARRATASEVASLAHTVPQGHVIAEEV